MSIECVGNQTLGESIQHHYGATPRFGVRQLEFRKCVQVRTAAGDLIGAKIHCISTAIRPDRVEADRAVILEFGIHGPQNSWRHESRKLDLRCSGRRSTYMPRWAMR